MSDIETLSSPDPESESASAGGASASDLVPLAGVEPEAGDEPVLQRLRQGGMTVGDAAMFASGDADLTAAGRRELEEMLPELKAAVAELSAGGQWSLRVEGHTDDRPVLPNGRWSSNWALSAARASTIAEYLVDKGFPARHLMAVGFADTQPLVQGDDNAARNRNRRIQLRLVEG